MTVDINALKTDAEAAQKAVTRMEVVHESAVNELATARPRLKELAGLAGLAYDETIGTVSEAEIDRRAGELAQERDRILADIATVRDEAGIA